MVRPHDFSRPRYSNDRSVRNMETINRFSSASTDRDSRPPSLSSRFSVSDLRSSHSIQTPVSSTMGVNDPYSPTNGHATNSAARDNSDSSSCQDDPDIWFQQFRDEIGEGEISDELPTAEQLDAAADIPIYDADGNSRPFRHLFQGAEHQGQRQLIIFVRHFYCGVCQAYIKALTDTITPTRYFSLPTPTTITLIGCGRPRLLAKYMKRTECPFRMYSEPTRKLYKALQMPLRWVMGKKNSYHDLGQLAITKDAFGQMIKAGRKDGFCGGHMLQVGGEFLFEDGQCIWTHRMKVIRGHAEMKVISRILDMESDSIRIARQSGNVPQMSPVFDSTPNKSVLSTKAVKSAKSRESVGPREPPPALISGKAKELL